MPSLDELRKAAALVREIDARECPIVPVNPPGWHLVDGKLVADFEPDDVKALREATQEKRAAWFKVHWPELAAAKKHLDELLGLALAQRGVHIKSDGCGCCDSPHLTVWLDREFIHDGGNWYFGNVPEEWVMPDDAAWGKKG